MPAVAPLRQLAHNDSRSLARRHCVSERFSNALAELRTAIKRTRRAFDEDVARQDIETAVAMYAMAQHHRANAVSGATRRRHYAKLLAAVRSAREGYEQTLQRPELVDPLVWAWGDLDEQNWSAVESVVADSVRHLQAQEQWLVRASTEASATVVRNRPKGARIPGLEILVNMLADAWERHMQADAGISRPPGSGSPRGPFVRFVSAVLTESNLSVDSVNVPEYVAKVIQSRDRNLARSRRLRLLEKFAL